MNKNLLIKVLLAVVVIAAVLGAGYYFQSSEDKSGNTLADDLFGWKYPVVEFPLTGPNDLAYSDIRDPGGIPEGLPVRLKIPAIEVDSAIEDALITPSGRMDVPAGSKNVAWFALGPHPGRIGSAVIGGHFGMRDGVPFVFYNLDKLVVGDKIYIVDDKGDTLAFQVRSIKLFDRNADATSVFTSSDGLAHLNLITCEGIWNRVNDAYPERRVIFTDAIKAEIPTLGVRPGDAATKADDLATFYRTFGKGASGADVAALQRFLGEKGFLVMPPGVAYGFFGALTGAATADYQANAGLPRAGVFGPQTRAKVLAELGGDTGLPNAGTEKVTTPSGVEGSSIWLQALQFIKSLYATPLDGLITTALLALIALMAFKILRR